MKMILPPLKKGDRGGFSRWIAPKSPLAPFEKGARGKSVIMIWMERRSRPPKYIKLVAWK
jgi:hypothetical protein